MSILRRRINPNTFVITLRQIAKHLKIDPKRILNWEKWQHVLWVHLEGRGGYFISYRKLEQWINACSGLLRFCRNFEALKSVWSAILKESDRYIEESLERLKQTYQQKQALLSSCNAAVVLN
jgi:hypothetical protein